MSTPKTDHHQMAAPAVNPRRLPPNEGASGDALRSLPAAHQPEVAGLNSSTARLLTRPPQIGSSQAELSALMRAWRRRLTPADVPGLVQYPRRRKQSLSQDDIARLVGSTSFWYGELERGKRGRYSDDFLDRVADALRLADDEREVLYRLGVGRQPVPRAGACGETSPAGEMSRTMERLVAAQQCPAYIIDSAFNIQACNAQARQWFPSLPSEPNLMRWAFTHPAAQQQLDRWEEDWAPSLLAQLRMAHAREPDNGSLTRVIRDIIASNEQARWCWENKPSVTDPGRAERGVRLPAGASPVTVEVITCSPLGYAGMQMVCMVPVDPAHAGAAVAAISGRPVATSEGRVVSPALPRP
ncbi:MmyB family transcriptional regulator [Micromonospora aurantiaca (nom. illeg.)]|uniref:MmyB family transcriptional regulator n=1 Tax=Micromonospora aurantiaca (nom. illeg.) TaxID=47850 RepID=UPI0033FA4AA7